MRSACVHSPSRIFLGLAVFSASLSGCASEGDALDKRIAKLQEEVTRVQSQTDRMAERLDAVELRQATAARPEERVASAAPTTVSRPKLKVVHVEADGEFAGEEGMASAPLDDTGPRVIIQGEGKSVESRSVPGTAKTPKPEPKAEPAKKSDPAKAAPK